MHMYPKYVIHINDAYMCVYMYKEIEHKELAHGIMEVDKSQDLQWESWRCRRDRGIVQV